MTKRLAVVVLVGVVVLAAVVAVALRRPSTEPWDAPPPKWVPDVGEKKGRSAHSLASVVSNGGRYVAFYSIRNGFQLMLMNMVSGRSHQIDQTYDGKPPQVGRIAYYLPSGGFLDMSPDGRYVVFESSIANLVPGDRNNEFDVFLYDRLDRRLVLVSQTSDGVPANGRSWEPSVSADGRYVAFTSKATNLSGLDDRRAEDVYLRDLLTKETTLISVGAGEKDHGVSHSPAISADGGRIAFTSAANNLVEDDTNQTSDVFVADVASGELTRVSVDSDGNQMGHFITTESATVDREGAGSPEISGDGEVVAFAAHPNNLVPEDDNDNIDVFLHEIELGTTERVSVGSDGSDGYSDEDKECGENDECSRYIASGDASLSHDGRMVYFFSGAPLLTEDVDPRLTTTHAFVHHRDSGQTVLVSRDLQGDAVETGEEIGGGISSDGRWVTFAAEPSGVDGSGGDDDPAWDVYLQELPNL